MRRSRPIAFILLAAGLLLAARGVMASIPPAAEYLGPGRAMVAAGTNTARLGGGDTNLAALESALLRRQQRAAEGPPPPPQAAPDQTSYLLICAVFLAGILVIRKLDLFRDRFRAWKVAWNRPLGPLTPKQKQLAEEPGVAAFLKEMRFALSGGFTELEEEAPGASGLPAAKKAALSEIQLEELLAAASQQLVKLHSLLTKAAHECEETVRAKVLLEFSQGMGELKKQCHVPELLPVWLMACALEGISHQASCNISRFTPSVRRTTAVGLDLLETLCQERMASGMVTGSPIQILGVDDNAICLRALVLALKKVFNEPSLATHGAPALAAAEKQTFDVIFLDVDMPGMNGFDVCKKIHETAANRTTPVVFVTSHGDFESRARAADVGGQDLIAKPYLPSEITVKALTLAMRGRLRNSALERAGRAPQALPKAGPEPQTGGSLPLVPAKASLAGGAAAAA